MTEKTNETKDTQSFFKHILDGSILTKEVFIKQLPFIMFLTLLAIIYIGNQFHAKKLVRETSILQTEIEDLMSESTSIASELMYLTKQSEVSRLVHERDLELEESVQPPYRIIVEQK